MPNNNGKNPPPPESLHFQRSPVICKRCNRVFEHFVIEEIDNLAQLRCGDVLIPQTKMVCMHCGSTFWWDVQKHDIEKMAVTYGELIKRINGYAPE